jgi:glycogen synthase
MRVLMLAQFYPPDIGGEERHARNLSIALMARGHDVEVLTTALPETGAGSTREDGVMVHRVRTTAQRLPIHSNPARPHATPFPDFEMRRAIARLLSVGKFDIAHAHNWIINSATGPAVRHDVPLVMTLHDYANVCAVKRFVHDGKECTGPGVAKCLSCAADHYGPLLGPATVVANGVATTRRQRSLSYFIAVSAAVAQHNQLSRGRVPFEIVPNFIPDGLVQPAPPAPNGPIVFVGDLTMQKGVLVLAEAYAQLGAGAPELLLAGRPEPGIEIPAIPGIRTLGPLSHQEILELMSSARLVVVPSIMPDPCPTVVLEAMAVGRPVVASGNGGIVDMVDDGSTGILVRSQDPQALASALAKVIRDQRLAASMGGLGAVRVQGFTASTVVQRIERIYERCTESELAPV